VTLTSSWFGDAELEALRDRYRSHPTPRLGYATVRDFVDGWEHLRPLATAQGDLKDAQRPWTLKALLARVPMAGRVLEIGAGQPYVADLLARLGYDVWVVDPYDGSGNGPVEYERYCAECPDVRFVRERFRDGLAELEPRSFDAVYSISVLEHVDGAGLGAIARGMREALLPSGVSIHSVDHVLRGRGAEEHLSRLRSIVERFGGTAAELDETLARASADTDTYYLSAEAHNRWRGNLPYDDFPMRVCVSVQLVTDREGLSAG
jgi:SAM-dependent methyltransferase